eukprot:PhM_4_TR16223/c0_g1_i1/m.74225/K01230/MAN1; mannosyl-oligosaccharide alpha-1,2-mannosidase
MMMMKRSRSSFAALFAFIVFLSFVGLQLHLSGLVRDHSVQRHHPALPHEEVPGDSWGAQLHDPHCIPVPCENGVYVPCYARKAAQLALQPQQNRNVALVHAPIVIKDKLDKCVCYQDSVLGHWSGKTCGQCEDGFFGGTCTVPCNAKTTCNDHGTCGVDGLCACTTPYFGENCERRHYLEDKARRNRVREEMRHAWGGYRRYAMGHDELMPLSKAYKDWANGGIGLTLVDALDTLKIMGLDNEFDEAQRWVKTSFNFQRDGAVSVFESTIRIIGGFMSVYGLTGEELFLKKALEVYERLAPAFGTDTGIPYSTINTMTGELANNDWARGMNILSEFGSIQLEFNYLSDASNRPEIRARSDAIMALLHKLEARESDDGIFPVYYHPDLGHFTSSMATMGGMGDSYYEYLLKQWVQSGHRDRRALDMYRRAIKGMRKYLIGVTPNKRYTFLLQRLGENTRERMDHLSCFAPGMLVLGLQHDANVTAAERESTLELAKALMETCIHMYEFTPTGLSPEDVSFEGDEMVAGVKWYILRPETIESLFYLWRYTHDERYRDVGYRIFESVVKHCRVPNGYSGYRNVLIVNWDAAEAFDIDRDGKHTDVMDSFFLAETLKYLYLLFSEDELFPLDKFVFNTEAHPFPILES